MGYNQSRNKQLKPHSTADRGLNLKLREEFERDGVVFIKELFSGESINSLKSSLLTVREGLYATGLLPDKLRRIKSQESPGVAFHSACNVWKSDSEIKKALLQSKLGEVAGMLMNWDSCKVNQDTFFSVEPGFGPTTFHQDNPYQKWHSSRGGVVTAWIAIEDVLFDMGGLEFALGSHKNLEKGQILREPFLNSSDYKTEFEKFQSLSDCNYSIVRPLFSAGDVTFHHGDLWHGSALNNSDRSRLSYSVHLMDGTSKFTDEVSPYFSRFKKDDSDEMDASFFPMF